MSLLLAHAAMPSSALLGHMCGVVAGLLHAHVITPGVDGVVNVAVMGCV